MKKYGQFLKELPSRKVVFAACEFKSINRSHTKLIDAVIKLSVSQDADAVVFVTNNSIQPISFLSKLYPRVKFIETGSFVNAAVKLSANYKNLVYVCSAVDESSCKKMLEKFKSSLKLDTIQYVPAIAESADGTSKQMIDAAKKGDFTSFKKLAPVDMIELEVKRLFNAVRSANGAEPIKEQIKFETSDIREKYHAGEIFKLEEIVESAGEVFKITKRGSNHLLLQAEDGSLVSKWLHDVQSTEKSFNLQEGNLSEMKYSTTDKMKIAKVIATSLGVENVDKFSNPEMLVNAALHKVRPKAVRPEYVSILGNMLAVARDAGINYDEHIISGIHLEPEKSDYIEVVEMSEEKEEEEHEEMSDDDIEKMLDGLKDEDYYDAYDDDELHLVDAESGEHITSLKEELINEVLSRAERIKAKVRFARSEAKRERKIQIALKTRSSSQVINKRARRLAINLMKQRLARKPLDKLTVGEKERIERIIERRKPAINRIAMKLVPRIKKVETDRLTHRSFTK